MVLRLKCGGDFLNDQIDVALTVHLDINLAEIDRVGETYLQGSERDENGIVACAKACSPFGGQDAHNPKNLAANANLLTNGVDICIPEEILRSGAAEYDHRLAARILCRAKPQSL